MRSVWSLTSELTIAAGVLIFCAVWTFGQSGKCEEVKSDPPPITHFQIIERLQSRENDKKSAEWVNQGLIDEIKKRSVDFALYDDLSNEIRKLGGSDDLLNAIDEAIPSERKPRLQAVTRLDKLIRDNYARIKTLSLAVAAGKEFLEKYADEPCFSGFVEWLKAQMPKFELRLKNYERATNP